MTCEKTMPDGGMATILLVDDEEMITDAIGALLEKVGYRVICAGGGQEAVQLVEKNSNNISLVILDMLMPDMDGRTVFHRIKKIQPEMPVLMASGFNHRDQIEDVMNHGCKGFIQKPYSLAELHPTIQGILAENRDESNSDCTP